MGLFNKIVSGLRRQDVIFRAYMINGRDSEFKWKTELEELCKGYPARVRSNKFDVVYEAIRLNALISNLVSTRGLVPESVRSKVENIDELMYSGMHLACKVFDITISMDPEELKEKNVGDDALEELKDEAERILEDSNPWYLSVD